MIVSPLGGVVKIDHPEHCAVVGQRQRRHAQLPGALDQLLDVAEAIQQRVFGMDVQVDEGHRSNRLVKVVQPGRIDEKP
jgi:hypothetical protein